jgi:hypothetical protein
MQRHRIERRRRCTSGYDACRSGRYTCSPGRTCAAERHESCLLEERDQIASLSDTLLRMNWLLPTLPILFASIAVLLTQAFLLRRSVSGP